MDKPALFSSPLLHASALCIPAVDIALSRRVFQLSTAVAVAILAAVAFVVMAASGFVLDLRHLRGLFDNYSNRISASVGSAIAVDPVVTSDSVFFGALVPTFTSAHD